MSHEDEIKEKLAIANRILVNENLTELGRGHVAYKIDEGKILIPGHLHDYNRSIADCNVSDIVKIDYNGKVLEGNYPESMHEFFFYIEVFKIRKEVKAALHMHAFYTNILFMTGQKLALASRDSFLFVDGVKSFDGLPLFVNTREMGKNMAEALGGSIAIVHRGHGTFMVGQSIEEVVISAASLERACKKQVLASSIGELLEYDEKEIRKTNTNEIRQEVTDIDWGYFTTRLSKFGMTG